MMLVRKPFVIYLERKRLDNMWKVLVIICMVGYDCTAFQQSPIQFYHSYDECISVAIEKENILTTKYAEHGYYITDSKATCKQHPVT